MKKILLSAFFAMLCMACHPQKSGVENIAPQAFQTALAGENNPQLIDVRTPKEFAEGHLKNAQNIHLYDQDFAERIDKLDKNKTVYVYCKAGGRSAEAVEIMHSNGFSHIIELDGGTDAWQEKGMPLNQ
ncbi:rhodanese-like domain-containing protein [Flavobacterium sp. NST-5]|uniref:Rhodanese-like domain-containing protein n=1 Tax=Flavobacterium ichthyis TaxID=2698827 RepID=A0ABW9Z5K4_9FLAO|nr:rhodanese-like domain-containing protein [Flavobacterium ichthyis]NBL64131.1 rhodanese-like domain-containing protein [Flavobacterium ichthyis]